MLDLAEELAAGLKDGSIPAVLGLDRVWITADGRAKLLDFTAPGAGGAPAVPQTPAAAPDFEGARAFLNQVALAALEGRIVDVDAARGKAPAAPVPLHARKFLTDLATFEGVGPLLGGLRPLMQKVASVTPRRRFGLVAVCAVFPIFMAGAALLGAWMMQRWMESQPDIMPLQVCLFYHSMLEKPPDDQDRSRQRQALEIYIAGRFGKTISDPATWSSLFATAIAPDLRERAKQIVAKYPSPSQEEFNEAKAVAEPLVGGAAEMGYSFIGWSPVSVAVIHAGVLTLLVAIGGLVCALAFRSGPAMWILGVVAVKRDGSRAGRLRVFWRALVTWSPLLVGLVGLVVPGEWVFADPAGTKSIAAAKSILVFFGIASGLTLGLFAALATVSALMPERGLQDRLAGTWLVPR
jgi:hypothetical protein